MNAIANTTLPSESVIIDRLEKRGNTYNGFGSLLEAFLTLIPEPAKVPENDSHIERIYHNVGLILKLQEMKRRNSSVPTWKTSSENPLTSPQHWHLT